MISYSVAACPIVLKCNIPFDILPGIDIKYLRFQELVQKIRLLVQTCALQTDLDPILDPLNLPVIMNFTICPSVLFLKGAAQGEKCLFYGFLCCQWIECRTAPSSGHYTSFAFSYFIQDSLHELFPDISTQKVPQNLFLFFSLTAELKRDDDDERRGSSKAQF